MWSWWGYRRVKLDACVYQFINLSWNFLSFFFFLRHWIQYTSYYRKPKVKSINKVSDHSANTFVPGAIQPLRCVDIQVGMAVIFSLQKTKLTSISAHAPKVTAKRVAELGSECSPRFAFWNPVKVFNKPRNFLILKADMNECLWILWGALSSLDFEGAKDFDMYGAD